MISVTTKVSFSRSRNGRKKLSTTPRPAVPPGRVPRVSKLMALAIRLDQLMREGKVAEQSELARLAHVTQPRMTQIMNLLHLAPDIQEQILVLPAVERGRDPLSERDLRTISSRISWSQQRAAWQRLAGGIA